MKKLNYKGRVFYALPTSLVEKLFENLLTIDKKKDKYKELARRINRFSYSQGLNILEELYIEKKVLVGLKKKYEEVI